MDAIRLDVAYRFSEYRAYFLAHLVYLEGIRPGFFGRMFFSTMAAMFFVIKKRKVGRCFFTINEEGIRRRANDGEPRT